MSRLRRRVPSRKTNISRRQEVMSCDVLRFILAAVIKKHGQFAVVRARCRQFTRLPAIAVAHLAGKDQA